MISKTPLIFDESKQGRKGFVTPRNTVGNFNLKDYLPNNRKIQLIMLKKASTYSGLLF